MVAMKRVRVTVIDMQPITPAVGGGRLRLLGLYHALGSDIECTYVGSFDWPGEAYRDAQIRPGLREIVVPLSQAHHTAAAELSQKLAGRTVIDAAFPLHAELSPEFLHVAREHIASADIVVFTHPWCFPALEEAIRPDQLVVHDSQNVETLLKTELLGDLVIATPVLHAVASAEQAVLARSDLVLACSDGDVELFQKIFDADPIKFRVVPNGTFVDRFPGIDAAGREALREKLCFTPSKPIAIFLGSHYGPNIDAALFIARTLAQERPEVTFVIAGGVGHALATEVLAENVVVTGEVDDLRRDELLLSAHLALNPMSAGSGTNIKMFDYMAAGLPVLTTEIGARGIGTKSAAPEGIFVESLDAFPRRCKDLIVRVGSDESLSIAVRDAVRRYYSWERISAELGKLFRHALDMRDTHYKTRPRVALLSTWNVTCGIGEHAAYLADALVKAGAQVAVLANSLKGHKALGFERDLHMAVSRAWNWDNRGWRESKVDRERFVAVLELFRPTMLIVQHHTAFAPVSDVEYVVQHARSKGVSVVVEMHDARNVSAEYESRLCVLGALLVVHHADEVSGVDSACHKNTRVFPLPAQGSQSASVPDPAGVKSSHGTIGGFGFLRPYKGLMYAIQAIAILKRTHPHVRYRGWHALYESDDSARYLEACLNEAERLGVRDAVEIDTRFITIESVLENLRTVDAVLMPYEPSEEGASAAVNLAIAAGRPVVTSPSSIFRSVSEVVVTANQHDPKEYAAELKRIIENPLLAKELSLRSQAWAEGNSYLAIAKQFLALESI